MKYYYNSSLNDCRRFIDDKEERVVTENNFEECEDCQETCSPKAACSGYFDGA